MMGLKGTNDELEEWGYGAVAAPVRMEAGTLITVFPIGAENERGYVVYTFSTAERLKV